MPSPPPLSRRDSLARGDALFARCNVDWPTKPKCRKLKSGMYKWVNHCIWLACVRERTDTLPADYDQAYFTWFAGCDARTYRGAVAKMQELGLIQITKSGRIKLFGVKSNNAKISFKDLLDDSPQPPHTPPITGLPKGEGKEESPRKTEGEESGVGSDDFQSKQRTERLWQVLEDNSAAFEKDKPFWIIEQCAQKLVEDNFFLDIVTATAFVLDSRRKKNPKAWLTTVADQAKHGPTDRSIKAAKQKLNVNGRN